MNEPYQQRHVLTVGLEDFFQVDAFNGLIEPRQWSQFERRLEQNTTRTLALLDAAGVHATFFVLGWIADVVPELVRSIADRGHEVASRGYDHRSVGLLDPVSFRDDLSRSREAIERAAGVPVLGHRAARLWYSRKDLWALDVLAGEGYAYDASLAPFLRRFAHEPWRRYPHTVETRYGSIHELPVSTTTVWGQSLPIAGGNYARQLPAGFIRRRVERWMGQEPGPFVMYFHVWELDPEQPRVAAPLLQRIRQYRNLDRMHDFLAEWMARHPFGTAADFLDLTQPRQTLSPPAPTPATLAPAARPRPARMPVSIVIPCHNLAGSVDQLAGALDRLESELSRDYAVRYVLVDDGSSDATWPALERVFLARAETALVRHPRHLGSAAAIRTGVLHARTEIVCSLDAERECDPQTLRAMLALMTDGVDIVTASPYHHEGLVTNVPAWRQAPVRSLSRLYRLLLGVDLISYTTGLRVYRRSAVAACRADRNGPLGTSEILGRVLLAGGLVVEHPAQLPGRAVARPAWELAGVIAGHLGLAAAFAWTRAQLRFRRGLSRTLGMAWEPGRGLARGGRPFFHTSCG
jgi:polysaccharide deacetylase family protein (PEP-CTERM system associated)